MDAEWRNFTDALPFEVVEDDGQGGARVVGGADHPVFPYPAAPKGLPEGWAIRYSAPYQGRDPKATYESFVIERVEGGWTIAFHIRPDRTPKVPKTNLINDRSAPTIEALYHLTVAIADTSMGGTSGVERLLSDYIVSCYDLSDPTEAAEATLVGLGARITLFPRALRDVVEQ